MDLCLTTVNTAIRDWHVNVIRLPLAQARWFGKAPEQKDEGKAYRALVHQVVDRCAAAGRYVILDLHWSDADEWGKQIDVLARLFGGQGTINVPCWSPDGRQIAFVSYQFIPEDRAHPSPRP